VLFSSGATNLAPEDDNGRLDIFLRDRARRVTRLCTKSSAGLQTTRNTTSGQLSRNGRFMFFISPERLATGADGSPDLYSRGPYC
jgi:hypothetical protein